MGQDLEELERRLAASKARCAGVEDRSAMLEEQLRIVQWDRDTFERQLRQRMRRTSSTPTGASTRPSASRR